MVLQEKIKNKLDTYLEFDSNELFCSDLIYIFGGALRDIIVDDKVNDIDILCGSISAKLVENLIESKGYKYMEGLIPKSALSIYSELQVINEPHTFINKNNKVIQIIKPVIPYKDIIDQKDLLYREGFFNLISNVDLSCCGISYNSGVLYENYPNALLHCTNKVFSINKNATMYSQRRVYDRINKLVNRGWEEVENTFQVNRSLKIGNILDIV